MTQSSRNSNWRWKTRNMIFLELMKRVNFRFFSLLVEPTKTQPLLWWMEKKTCGRVKVRWKVKTKWKTQILMKPSCTWSWKTRKMQKSGFFPAGLTSCHRRLGQKPDFGLISSLCFGTFLWLWSILMNAYDSIPTPLLPPFWDKIPTFAILFCLIASLLAGERVVKFRFCSLLVEPIETKPLLTRTTTWNERQRFGIFQNLLNQLFTGASTRDWGQCRCCINGKGQQWRTGHREEGGKKSN